MARVFDLKDIGPYLKEELAFMGIHSTEDLLKCLSSNECILDLERSAHIDRSIINGWAKELKKQW